MTFFQQLQRRSQLALAVLVMMAQLFAVAAEPSARPAIDAAALASQVAARNSPSPKNLAADANDRLFATFAYTGDGVGGAEERLAAGVLAYSDDAVIYLESVPKSLAGARLIRTANRDRKYWANDYIVATAARDLDLFVAHDDDAPRPAWLKDFKPSGDVVRVKGKKLTLLVQQLKQGAPLRIPGNVDQGQNAGTALNFILFARPAGFSSARNQ